MADKKITDDSLLSGASVDLANDVIPIVDVSEASPSDRNKKITPSELKIALGVPSVPDASETVKGIAEIATQTETNTGTDDLRFVTPLKLKNQNYLALLASPTFTGTPAAPTAAQGNDTTQLATTAFVQQELYTTFLNAT